MPTAKMKISETILQQLGGRKFITMTGANNFIGGDGSLSARLPSGLASNNANGFRITLNERDYYDIRFYRIRACKLTELEGATDIGAENLRSTFERLSGLRLSL